MKILLITEPKNEEFIEDKWFAEGFEADGHEVVIVNKNYPEELEHKCDIFLKRNCWSTEESDFVLGQDSDLFKQRLVNKDLPRINCDGKFDGSGKIYLCELYDKGYAVIPSIKSPEEFYKLRESKFYLLKPHNGLDGFGIRKVTKLQAKKEWNKHYIIQPKLDFVSEVQFYFVGNKFEYAFEFAPSKVPIYPDAISYRYTKSELALAQQFANLSPNYNGVQRIDFLKLPNGELKLIEIEDSSPYLELDCLSRKKRKQVIDDYKNMVYTYKRNYDLQKASEN